MLTLWFTLLAICMNADVSVLFFVSVKCCSSRTGYLISRGGRHLVGQRPLQQSFAGSKTCNLFGATGLLFSSLSGWKKSSRGNYTE